MYFKGHYQESEDNPWNGKKYLQIKYLIRWDFPGGPVVKNPLSNAGDMASIPGQGTKILPGQGTKIPHAEGQLSLSTANTEPTSQN